MLRSAAWPKGLATTIGFASLLGCAPGPRPDEGDFKLAVVLMLVEAAKRSGGTVDGDDAVKTIVFDGDSFPGAIQDVAPMIKQGLEGAGITWLDADIQNDARNLPGEWRTFRNDSTLKFNRTHSDVQVRVEGERARSASWNGGLCADPSVGTDNVSACTGLAETLASERCRADSVLEWGGWLTSA